MTDFNRHVYSCAPEGFSLSDEEQALIANMVSPSLQRWAQLPHVQAALIEHNELNASLSLGDIQERERLWEEAFLQRSYENVAAWLDEDLAEDLAGWVAASDGIVLQVVLLDARGFTVAASAMPADYWLGKTSIYKHAIEREPGQLVFDTVRFYRSTERFNAHVSVVVGDSDTGEILGVLSVGVNVEEALFTEWPRR